ncbi:MAG: hypothetical protein ACJARD_001642 [Alphaproteobacteria bacterium]|jgi:uncharacterized protein YjfI (DUF2170 family)
MVDVAKLGSQLIEKGQEGIDGFIFDIQSIPGEIEVLKVSIEGREELPIFLSNASTEILCISYLFKENEILESANDNMHSAMITMNIPMPLSSFGKIRDQYVIFGALSTTSTLDDIVHEIITLSDNTLEAIKTMREYLK